MVKRPLVLLTLFYLFGILAGSSGAHFRVLFPVLIFLLLIFRYSVKKYRRERTLLLAPLFLAAGFFLTRQAMLPTALERFVSQGGEGSVTGTVLSCEEGQSAGRIVLSVTELHSFAEGQGTARMASSAEEASCFAKARNCRILVYTEKEELLAPGSIVTVYGEWTALARGDNPGQFDEYSYYKAQGISAKMTADAVYTEKEGRGLRAGLWRLRRKMKEVYRRVLPQQEAGILEAMLLAEKGGLTQEIKEMYRDAGFSHILAVSGLHLSLIGMGFYKLLKKLRAGSNAAAALACGMVILYSIFTGAGIPVVRAAVMLLLSLLSAPAGKTYDAPTGLAAAALLILSGQPLQLFQAGFLLSFGAAAGILLFSRRFEAMGLGRLSASVAVQLALLPLLLWFYYEVPVYALLLNLLLLPFLSLLLMLAILIGALGSVWLPFGRFFAGGAYALLKGYEGLCRLNELLPGNRLCRGRPAVWQMLLYYALLMGFYLLCGKIKKKKCFLFLAAFAVFLLPGDQELTVTYLAVGQGDCAVLQKGDMTVLIDAGSSLKNGAERILVPYLQYHGDTQIEYVLLSHTDEDHCSMLTELLDEMAQGKAEVTIQTLLMTEAAQSGEKYEALCKKAEAAGVLCMSLSAGDALLLGGDRLLCLYPQAGETAGDSNENSMVLALCTEEALCLFTGDISAAQERRVAESLLQYGLLAQPGRRFLKTAHHGSRYSSCEELLRCFSGGTAVISCGRSNRYGHPHADSLARMREAGVFPVITWESGAVRVRAGKMYLWHAFLEGKGEWRQ